MALNEKRIGIIKEYLTNLEAGKPDEILKLFEDGAKITSPMTPGMPVKDFFPNLFAQLKTSKIDIVEFYNAQNDSSAAVYFKYNWELQDGSKAGLTCVDIIKFSGENLIKSIDVVAYPIRG